MKDKKTLYLAIAAGIISTLAIIGAVFLLLGPELKAVDFTSKNVKEVLTWQKENNIADTLIEYKFEFDEKVEKDIIISQSVKAGDIINDRIIFTVSKGSDPTAEVTLIDFKDLDEVAIKKFFTDNKFTDVTYEIIPHEKIEKGKFIKLNIEETKVKRNTLIVVSISAGSASLGIEIDMPDFADSNKSNIDAWAKTNNITVTYTYAHSDKFEEGKVITFTPKAKEKIKTGGKIAVTLSKGKGITLSNLVGKTEADATKWLKDNELNLDKIEVFSEKTKGSVTFLDPKAGSIVAKGAKIKVYISAGVVPVDNFVGKPKANVDSWLATINKKFSNTAELKVVYQEIDSSTVTAGNVIKMSFDGSTYSTSTESGKTAKPGQTITVQISKGTKITVADKRGSSEASFKTYIEGLKLKYAKGTDLYSETYAVNTIVKHSTGSFSAGSTVTYQLSKGKYSPVATTFNNKTVDAINSELNAANNLEAGGWSFGNLGHEFNAAVDNGKTFDCSISGKKVSCKVSKGASITVPNYVGATKPCAENGCTANDLKINYVYESNFNENTPKDQVMTQSIASGSAVAKGTTITLTLSKGADPNQKAIPSIPRVVDATTYEECVKNITNLLNSQGFYELNFVKVSGELDNPNKYNGIFKSINPNEGTVVPTSSIITIEIYG